MKSELDLLSPVKPPKVRKPRKPTNLQIVITNLVADMQSCKDKALWGREGRLASLLIKNYGAEFMTTLQPPEGRKIGSLMWFYSVIGKSYLSDKLVEFKNKTTDLTPQQQEILLAPDKIGDDVVIQQKPKTLKDFLNYGKETRTNG